MQTPAITTGTDEHHAHDCTPDLIGSDTEEGPDTRSGDAHAESKLHSDITDTIRIGPTLRVRRPRAKQSVTASTARDLSKDVHVDEIMALYTYVFLVWRLGRMVLLAAQSSNGTASNSTPAPGSAAPSGSSTLLGAQACLRRSWTYVIHLVLLPLQSLHSLIFKPNVSRRQFAFKIALAITVASMLTIIPSPSSRLPFSYWAAVSNNLACVLLCKPILNVRFYPNVPYCLIVHFHCTSLYIVLPSNYSTVSSFSLQSCCVSMISKSPPHCALQTTIGMVADERVGGTFRNGSIRLQGTVAGSVFGFLVATAFKVFCPFTSCDTV